MNIVKRSKNNEPLDTNTHDQLDTETTIADMNVEGMPWYEPNKRGGGQNSEIPQLSKSEQRAVIRGALLSALPLIGCLLLAVVLAYGLVYLWLS